MGTLELAHRAFARADFASCKTFDELFAMVSQIVTPIPWLGELYAYDTSLWIGASRGLLPDAVYMHSGTRDGARALGIDRKEVRLDPRCLPRELRGLSPRHIEDVLCIYKDAFETMGAS
jgi:hypothetical protein